LLRTVANFHDPHDLVLHAAAGFHDPHDLALHTAASFHDPHDLVLHTAADFHEHLSILARKGFFLKVAVLYLQLTSRTEDP
jgi:hypothetical protein